MNPLDAVEALVKLIGIIGDAKAWRLAVRMWAYKQVGPGKMPVEGLEEWVHEADRHLGVFGGQRREALRMWAYEQFPDGDLTLATELYDWSVQAEDRFPSETPAPDRPGGFDDEARRLGGPR